jgi:hypothetical protein
MSGGGPGARWRTLAAIAAIAPALLGACRSEDATTITKERREMSDPPLSSRPPAPEVEPIEHKGVRYVQDRVDRSRGDQNGGYLAAIDAKSGKRLWRLEVYDVEDDRASGVSDIGLYFRSMRLVPGRDALEIENEAGSRYRVDLVERTSTLVSAPRRGAQPAAPAKPKPEPE